MKSGNAAKRLEDLERVVKHIPIGITYMDLDLRVQNMNSYLLDKLGMTADDVVGRHCYAISAESKGEDPEDAKPCGHCLVPKAIETEENQTFVNEVNPDFIIETTTIPLKDERGEIVWTMELHKDITEQRKAEEALQKAHDELESKVDERIAELRESEEKYRDLFENANDSIFLLDKDLNYIDVNQKGLEVFGYTKAEFLKLNVKDLLPPEVLPLSEKEFSKLKKGEPYSNFVGKAKTKDGRLIDIEVSSTPIMDGERFLGSRDILRDITERKKAEVAIREANARLETLVQSMPDLVTFKDVQGRHLVVNKAIEEFMGKSHDELIGKGAEDIFPPEIAAQCQKSDEAAMRSPSPVHSEETVGEGEGGVVLDTIKSPIRDEDGNVAGLVMVSRDITERKRAEKRIQESEEKYRSLFDTVNDGISLHDLQARFLDANEKFCEITGYTKEELLTMKVTDLQLPERREHFPSALKEIREKGSMVVESLSVRKDGSIIPIEVSARYIEEGGKKFFLNVYRDITERKQAEEELQKAHDELEERVDERTAELRESEERYRSLIENAEDTIFTLSPDGVITSLNPAFESNTGWPRSEWIGQPFSELVHPDDQRLATEIFRCLTKRETPTTCELRILSKSGEDIVGEFKIAPQFVQGEIAGILGIARDITERKRAEENLKRRLMKFDLKDGTAYLVKESRPGMSLEAFGDLLKLGYPGLVISRTRKEEFKGLAGDRLEFLWLAERGGKNTLAPNPRKIEQAVEGRPARTTVLLDRLDYLVFKNGFRKILSLVQRLSECAYLAGHVLILSIDPSTLEEQELRALERETKEVVPARGGAMPVELLEVLQFVRTRNNRGKKPSFTEAGKELGVSQPTLRKRVRTLASEGYLKTASKGNRKVLELTERGTAQFAP